MLNKLILGLVVAFGFVVGAQAQDEGIATKLEKRKARMAKAMMAKFGKADLDEKQLEAVKEIFMKHVDELVEAQNAVTTINKKIRDAIVASLPEEKQQMFTQKRNGKKGKDSAKKQPVSVALKLPNMT